MRVLVATSPGIGHAFPTVPLAWALRAAGHDVLMVTGGDGLAVRNAGLPVFDVCPGQTLVMIVKEFARRHPDMFAQFTATPFDDFFESLPYYAMMMTDQPEMMDRYVRVAEEWRPDLVVYSSITVGGLVGAAKVGVPAVEHGYGLFRTTGFVQRLRELNAEVFDRHGVEPPTRLEAIDIAPPSLVDYVLSGWHMRYVPYNGGGLLPNSLTDLPARPRIAVTLGTTGPNMEGLGALSKLLDVAPGIDADFMLVLGDAATDELGALPDNAHALGWVPLNLLLPLCAGVIHHGGSGTTLTALDAGLPQIMLPEGSDRHVNATAVAKRGAGLAMRPGELTKEAVDTLVHDVGLRAAAREVRTEMRALPTPMDMVGRITALTEV